MLSMAHSSEKGSAGVGAARGHRAIKVSKLQSHLLLVPAPASQAAKVWNAILILVQLSAMAMLEKVSGQAE